MLIEVEVFTLNKRFTVENEKQDNQRRTNIHERTEQRIWSGLSLCHLCLTCDFALNAKRAEQRTGRKGERHAVCDDSSHIWDVTPCRGDRHLWEEHLWVCMREGEFKQHGNRMIGLRVCRSRTCRQIHTVTMAIESRQIRVKNHAHTQNHTCCYQKIRIWVITAFGSQGVSFSGCSFIELVSVDVWVCAMYVLLTTSRLLWPAGR